MRDVDAIHEFMTLPRFKDTKRPYTAKDVARLTPPVPRVYASAFMATKLWKLLNDKYAKKSFSHTFGCLDPVQVVQASKFLETIYISGWQSSSTASIINEPGPDLADYPYNTVPNKCDQLYRAMEFHETRMLEAAERGDPKTFDCLTPIIADADAGHGGNHAMMRLTKLFIEAGAAGIHIEDQDQSTKKCGHMAGKVLVSTQQHIDRLVAARLQADICRVPLIIVCRTDAEAATQINSNSDIRDHPFILGCTNRALEALQIVIQRVAMQGGNVSQATKKWRAEANLITFWEAVDRKLGSAAQREKWNKLKGTTSIANAALIAKSMGIQDVYWNMDMPRSREGYYQIRGGLECCIERGKAYAPYSDLIWMETKKPGLPLARKFANGVKSMWPDQFLAYNLSPSFNWDATGWSDQELKNFQIELGKLGYNWMFITLAGFHLNALATDRFARAYKQEYMLAYVRDIQRQERNEGVETLTHQKWSGAHFVDAKVQTVSGGLGSTSAMGEENTEKQFGVIVKPKM